MSDVPLAVVVLTHADPAQFRRLVTALDDVPMFVHCDARTPARTCDEMSVAMPDRVRFIDRIPTQQASWSLVAAELLALREALSRTSARHIAVLSGSDYPLLSVEDLYRELVPWEGRTWLANMPMPYAPWRTRRHDDGGMWRLEHRFLTRGDNVVFVKGHPLRVPIRRAIPRDIEPRAASQWKIYAREHAQRLLDIADARPDLMRFWRSTLVPDESFSASILGSEALFGADRLPVRPTGAWFLQWDKMNRGHPRWLTEGDVELLQQARRSAPLDPDDTSGDNFGYDSSSRKLFARKVSTTKSGSLVDQIDVLMRT